MMNVKYLFGATLEASVGKTVLYKYKVGGIVSTHRNGGIYVLYDTEGEIRNSLTSREIKTLTDNGELVTRLRCVESDCVIKIVNFNDLRIREFEKDGNRQWKHILDEVIPRIHKGERTKEPSSQFARRVARYMGDKVDESVLIEIANKCGYRVKHFIHNYNEWCGRFNTKGYGYMSDYHYQKSRHYWWVELQKLKGLTTVAGNFEEQQ